MLELDHILWAAPDLDDGTRLIERLTGVAPQIGGSHPGFGTRNSLISLGEGLYFEIIAPDPAQPLSNTRGAAIAALPRPGLHTFALRTNRIDEARSLAGAAGLEIRGPVAMSRTRPDGVRLHWSILYLAHEFYGEAIPFVIDWQDSAHPSRTTPSGCRLASFMVLDPEPEPLAAIYQKLGLDMAVKRASQRGFLAVLETPRGEVVLSSP